MDIKEILYIHSEFYLEHEDNLGQKIVEFFLIRDDFEVFLNKVLKDAVFDKDKWEKQRKLSLSFNNDAIEEYTVLVLSSTFFKKYSDGERNNIHQSLYPFIYNILQNFFIIKNNIIHTDDESAIIPFLRLDGTKYPNIRLRFSENKEVAVVFGYGATKDRLKNFIDEHWGDVEEYIGVNNGNKRNKPYLGLKRNLEIYYKYIEIQSTHTREVGDPTGETIEVLVARWIKDEKGILGVDADYVRRIVSSIRKLKQEVNT